MRRHNVIVILFTALGFGLLPGQACAQGDRRLEATALQRALDGFKAALDERWSYRHANHADFDEATGALRTKAAAGLSIDEFGLELHKILALGIDGHSGVDGYQLPGRAIRTSTTTTSPRSC